jgi:hypothetical protein
MRTALRTARCTGVLLDWWTGELVHWWTCELVRGDTDGARQQVRLVKSAAAYKAKRKTQNTGLKCRRL